MNIIIVFETQTGTTQYVSEVMQKLLEQGGHKVTLHSVKYKGMEPDFTGQEVILFGAPTYEDGKLENSMKTFTARFNKDLSAYKVAVFGLGNSFYPLFCKAADALEEWVLKNNGKPLLPALRVDGFPDNLKPIEEWVNTLNGLL
jgi:flavodoxin